MKLLFIFASFVLFSNQQHKPIVDLQEPPYLISAEALIAIRVASKDLENWKEFPISMRKLENYDVRIRSEKPQLILDMIPRKRVDEPSKSGGTTSLGIAVRYTIDIEKLKVLARQRYQ